MSESFSPSPEALRLAEKIARAQRFPVIYGRVTRVVGLVVEVTGLSGVSLGDVCRITTLDNTAEVLAEVVGFHKRGALLMPYGELTGINPSAVVCPLGRAGFIHVGEGLLGRILNGVGDPIDGKGSLGPTVVRSIHATPPNPLMRRRITDPLETGIRTIDGLLTIGNGQRVGIFAGSGVGKSVTLGMIARNSAADVNVIGLIGERGREVREFIEEALGEEGLRRSVVVVATGDESALMRARSALVATTIAEYFREKGKRVLLMLDSITRVAMAWREIGLAVGEPPTTKGYPPSVFAQLPRLLERAGTCDKGSITGLYTVLVDGDDFNEPIADAARSILDGHIVLSRDLAAANHYPAIDFLSSKSRVRDQVITPEHRQAADLIGRVWAAYTEHKDLVSIGAYKPGTDKNVDAALAVRDRVLGFLQQSPENTSRFEETRQALLDIAQAIRQLQAKAPAQPQISHT